MGKDEYLVIAEGRTRANPSAATELIRKHNPYFFAAPQNRPVASGQLYRVF
jgi:hypothetical protein